MVVASPLVAALAATAAVLLILFFVGLSILGRGPSGQQTTLTSATELISQGRVAQATLLDQDAALALRTLSGEALWATYPHRTPIRGRCSLSFSASTFRLGGPPVGRRRVCTPRSSSCCRS